MMPMPSFLTKGIRQKNEARTDNLLRCIGPRMVLMWPNGKPHYVRLRKGPQLLGRNL